LLSYWAKQTSLLLFFGQIKNISSGKLYNEMSGSSDYLTVTGTAGSYTFQCPNTADYIAADTDYIWFDSLGTQRTVDESDLVSYDLPRTPVKYDNDTPYSIRWIAILKSSVTLTEIQTNKLEDSFELSLFWSGTSSDYGRTKGNRAGEQSVWSSYLDQTKSLLARMGTEPSTALKDLIDTTISDLISNDIWDYLVQFTKANIHNETDAKLN